MAGINKNSVENHIKSYLKNILILINKQNAFILLIIKKTFDFRRVGHQK